MQLHGKKKHGFVVTEWAEMEAHQSSVYKKGKTKTLPHFWSRKTTQKNHQAFQNILIT